jgi:hypothetical protein
MKGRWGVGKGPENDRYGTLMYPQLGIGIKADAAAS